MAKYTLGQADVLTPALAVEQLRSVEQDTKDSANVAKGNRGKQGRRPFDKSKVECYGCHEFGHFKSECLKGNGNKGQSDNTRPLKDRKASDKSATKPPVSDRRDKAAVANESEGNETNESAPSERVWMARYNEKTFSEWLLDSGATRHMTSNRRWFTRFRSCGGEVEFGDKGVQLVAGRGDISILIGGSTQEMTDVLYEPGMSVNLLSIIALDRRGFTVFFGSQKVTITDQLPKAFDWSCAVELAMETFYSFLLRVLHHLDGFGET